MKISYYFIIDLLFLIIIIFSIKYAYEKKIYIKIFDYIKLFIIITLSAKLSHFTGQYLQSLGITKVDTYATLIFISFMINFLFLSYSGKFFINLLNKIINSNKTRILMAKVFTTVEVIILFTLSLYIFMQLNLSKIYIEQYLIKSFSYKYIKHFYKSFLNDEFVNLIMNSDTGTNPQEVLFKCFRNSI